MRAQPKFTSSEIMKIITGGVFNKIRELFPWRYEIYWGTIFWLDRYLVKTVGFITDKVISEYVAKHR